MRSASFRPMSATSSHWHTCEALSDLLAEIADLETLCRTALDYVLKATGSRSGALMAAQSTWNNAGGAAGKVIVHKGLPKTWSGQLNDKDSELYKLSEIVLQSGEPLLAGQPASKVRAPKDLAAALPILAKSNRLGVLLLRGAHFSEEKIDLLTCLTPPIGRAILTIHTLGTVRDRARDLASLQAELTRMSFTTDFEGMQAHIIQGTSHILDAEASALILLDEEHDDWIIRKSLGEHLEWIYQVSPKEGKGLVKECLRTGKIVLANQASNDPRFDPSSDGLSGAQVNSLLCAPLVVNGQVLGAIQALNKHDGAFNDFDRDLLSMIAVLASNAMHGTRLIQQLKIANADLEANRWELLGSRNTLRALFDNLPASLYIIDPEYNLIAVNKSRANRTGEPPQSLVGQLCYQALFNRTSPCPDCQVSETLKEGSTTKRSETRWDNAEEPSEWEIDSYPILDENEQVTQAILFEQDETERHRLESILAQSEKLAAVGQLAAGVAHEINNPLTAIIANAQILHRELPADSELQESVDLISRAGARATQVVRNLLDFARKEEYHLGYTDLNETMERSLALVQHEILARRVQLTFEPDPKLPPILASPDHLQSVWLNLLLNAIDALDKSPAEIRVTTHRGDEEIEVSVFDNGKGIPPDRLTRIFEPFYTTKKAGRGTGLGLSVSHRIVKQHGGHIRVESKVGAGTEFTVILPTS